MYMLFKNLLNFFYITIDLFIRSYKKLGDHPYRDVTL
jgi:hypothetical protein